MVEYGKYQTQWLDIYGTINLSHWRICNVPIPTSRLDALAVKQNMETEFVYIGDWTPGDIEPYPSKKDGGYSTRQTNLERNVYHYWPEQPTTAV